MIDIALTIAVFTILKWAFLKLFEPTQSTDISESGTRA